MATDVFAGLTSSEFFGTLDESGILYLQQRATNLTLDENQTLFLQGDPADAIYIVETGSIEIGVVTDAGKKLTLNIMQPPDVFGEIAVLDGGVRTASAIALSPATLKRIGRESIVALLTDQPGFALEVIKGLCNRLRWISQQVEDLATADIETRLARKLVVLSNKFADSDGVLRMSQFELADFLGATRESVNKTLQLWNKQGIVVLSRGAIKVEDADRLRQISSLE